MSHETSLSPPPLVWDGAVPGPVVHSGLEDLHQDLGVVPELVLPVALGEYLLLVDQQELDGLALQLLGLVDVGQYQDVDYLINVGLTIICTKPQTLTWSVERLAARCCEQMFLRSLMSYLSAAASRRSLLSARSLSRPL